MKREDLAILKDGFNVAMLAEAFGCSVGRINELKSEPVEGQVYHKADINTDALFDFAVKHEVNLDAIDFEKIIAAKAKAKQEKIEYKVGTVTKFGTIKQIENVGKLVIYVIDTGNGIVCKNITQLRA